MGAYRNVIASWFVQIYIKSHIKLVAVFINKPPREIEFSYLFYKIWTRNAERQG